MVSSPHVHKCALHECNELLECLNDPCLEGRSIPNPPMCPEHMPLWIASCKGLGIEP